ncbi:phage holin family protein [Ammoniphilus sp. CFH 90114]|uniref:phage holin family protein n=1 Tax=Ammoniphilus sp. CFH 90114 TaxID=2493665 RepID=UPI00100ED282|nr:phage holin family protein [Ammoniphilus sp. CFH 90114]RXT04950.1 phage holin family protein [Ammoniphilus sp. CFH 90114]
MAWISHIIRFFVATIVLYFVGFLVPGFTIRGLTTAIVTAAVIAALGWIFEAFFGGELSPYGRGIAGFLSTALIIYLTKFIVYGVEVTLIGALLASLLVGIIDLFLPAKSRFWGKS